MPYGCHGRDARLLHGRLAWHHFFPGCLVERSKADRREP